MEFTLKDFFRVIKQYALLLVLIVLVGAFGLGGYTYFFIEPEYVATAKMQTAVGKSGNVKNYFDVISSDVILKSVANTVKDKYPGITASDICYMLTCTQEEGAEVFTLSITCSNANKAADLCNAVASAADGIALYNKESVTLITKADVPTSVDHPYKKNALLGGIVGVVVSVVIAFVILILDKRLYTREDLEKNFELKIIGEIPTTEMGEEGSLFNNEYHPLLKESYRKLRTNVIDATASVGAKKIAISSANENEGKTTVSLNLATALALSGKKVLLIDTDMKNPELSERLGKGDKDGLSEYLLGGLEKEIKCEIQDKLCFIPAGAVSEKSSELLMCERFKKLLEDGANNYDYIIVDLPAINLMADAMTVHTLVDGYVMATYSGISKIPDTKKAVNSLSQLDAKVFGFVLSGLGRKLKMIKE